MTDQVNLPLIWANTGGVTDPGDIKYSTGWVAEIPTFQNFNFVLQNSTKNLLALAEKGQWGWETTIAYNKGAQVIKNFTLYTCITAHTNQDPALDATHSYWTLGYAYGTNSANLVASHGLLMHEVNTVLLDKWDGNALSINNTNALIAFNTTGAFDNYVLGNVKGEFVVINVGNTEPPDNRNIDPVLGNSKRIFHEGHPPIQTEVTGTIPANPIDGKLYGRKDSNWIEVTATKVQEFPPQPVAGNGSGWYSLSDGELYIDINDGDSSQWVPATPPAITDIEPDINIARAGRKNFLQNGDFRIWQRGNSWVLSEGNSGYLIDRWFASVFTSTAGSTTITESTVLSNGVTYPCVNIVSTLDNSTGFAIAQGIENINAVKGKKFAVSFKLKSNVAHTKQLSIQYRDTVNSSTNAVLISEQDVVIPGDNVLHDYSFIVDATSVVPGVTNNTTVVGFKQAIWQNHTIDITEFQVEEITDEYPDATEFEYRPYAEELALCKRYYQEGYISRDSGYGANTYNYYARQSFEVELRTTPTIVTTLHHRLGFSTSPSTVTESDSVSFLAYVLSNAVGVWDTWTDTYTADAEL